MADSSSNQEDDLSLPRAAVNKMIKETMPNIRVSNDARELILNCCTEFIHLISSEANEICSKNTKKTISPEHIIEALESLGFDSYVADVQGVLQQFKTKSKKKSHRLENLGIPEEELLRQQQELFQKARMEQAQEEWLQYQQAQGAAAHVVPRPPPGLSGPQFPDGSTPRRGETTGQSTMSSVAPQLLGGRSTSSLGAPPPLTSITTGAPKHPVAPGLSGRRSTSDQLNSHGTAGVLPSSTIPIISTSSVPRIPPLRPTSSSQGSGINISLDVYTPVDKKQKLQFGTVDS